MPKEESRLEAMTRLLGEAHALADNGDHDLAAELARVALDEWEKSDA